MDIRLYGSLQGAIAANQTDVCDLPGCNKARIGISKYCATHRNNNARLGHPTARKVLAKEYAFERMQVSELIAENRSHSGVSNAVRWIQTWVDAAITGQTTTSIHGKIIGASELRRLADHGVTAEDILVESASFWVYMQRNKHKWLNQESERIALSMAVLSLAPREHRNKPKPDGTMTNTRVLFPAEARRRLGDRLRSHLLPLYSNLLSTINSHKDAVVTAREQMAAPLSFPVRL